MNIGKTLDELIKIANISKTEFAISLSMTPSGLSKILSGTRLPFRKDKKKFVQNCSRILATEIYEPHCYLKFTNLFPVIYDFKSEVELQIFLENCLEYTLNNNYDYESNEYVNNNIKENSYLGSVLSFNMFCCIMSELLINEPTTSYDIFSNLPYTDKFGDFSFDRIRILTYFPVRRRYNVVIDMNEFKQNYSEARTLLSYLSYIEDFIDLRIYTKLHSAPTNNFYFLIKNHFMLTISVFNGAFILTHIRHKGFINSTFTNISNDFKNSISFSNDEILHFITSNPSIAHFASNNPIKLMYNFSTLGYELYKNEIQKSNVDDGIKSSIISVIENIVNTPSIDFYITFDSLIRFYSKGTLSIPFITSIDVPKADRINYLKKFKAFENGAPNDIYVVNDIFPSIAVISYEDFSIVLVLNNNQNKRKVHLFKTTLVEKIIRGSSNETNTKSFNITSPEWGQFVEQLLKGQTWL